MPKILALAVMLFWSVAAVAADAVFPNGSAVGLVPPPGMSPSSSFSGFQDTSRGAAIVLTAMPPQAYAEVVAGFSDDARLAPQGIVADRRERLTVDGHPAFLLVGSQRLAGQTIGKWIMIIGAPTGAEFVVANIPEAAAGTYTESVLRAAFTSAVMRPPLSLAEQTAALPFAVRSSRGYRVVGTMGGNGVMLTDGPNETDPDHEQSGFVATMIDGAPAASERAAFTRGQFPGMRALQGASIGRTRGLVVGGLPAQEILGSARSQAGTALRIAMWTVFARDRTLLMLATTRPEKFDGQLRNFEALRDGMRIK